MKNAVVTISILMSIALTSCNQVKLDNIEAEGLIKKTLELPKTYRDDCGWSSDISMFGAAGKLDVLQADGLIYYNIEYHGAFTDPSLYVTPTDKGKPYFLGQKSNIYMFKTNDIDFNQINGISIDKETQTATVRFTLKATNVSPIAHSLSKGGYINYSLDDPINGELIFKKFDNGWQLQSDQNKSSSEIVNQFLKERK